MTAVMEPVILPAEVVPGTDENGLPVRDDVFLATVRDYVKVHPEELEMSFWGAKSACGTTACIAGHTALMVGAEPLWYRNSDGFEQFEKVVMPDGTVLQARTVAETVLGLSKEEADSIFLSSNDYVFDVIEQVMNNRWRPSGDLYEEYCDDQYDD